jgi:phage tail tape-measure protein
MEGAGSHLDRAAVGAGLGALELNPWTVAGGTAIGGLVGGALGYTVCSGAFEALYDVLYPE